MAYPNSITHSQFNGLVTVPMKVLIERLQHRTKSIARIENTEKFSDADAYYGYMQTMRTQKLELRDLMLELEARMSFAHASYVIEDFYASNPKKKGFFR